MAGHFLALAKCIDRRMRSDQTPLRQFEGELTYDVLRKIEEKQADPFKLFDMTPGEIGGLIHSQKFGGKVLDLVRKLPFLEVTASWSYF